MLFLITHAHTQQKMDTDSTRWDLSDAGREQATALARLPFWDSVDRIALSSEPKARLTVAPVLAARNLPMTVDPRYDELRRGSEWVGDYGARVAEAFAFPDCPAGGWETANDAQARFLAGIHVLADAFPRETIALVGHGLTFSLFRAHLLGQKRVDFGDWQSLSFCAIAEIGWPDLALAHDFQPVLGAPQIERSG